jgi:hypothetical protein
MVQTNKCCRYKRPEDAKMALEQMEGFELAGRQVCFVMKLLFRFTDRLALISCE